MSQLDNLDIYAALDPSNMYIAIFNFPEQLEKGAVIGNDFDFDISRFKNIKSIVLAGMGGSATAGDIVSSYLRYSLKIPFITCRNYRLPEYVDEHSLVILSSYSGNTEEVLAASEDAIQRKAKTICITAGGKLGEFAAGHSIPTIKMPPGLQPRAALGYSVIPLMYLMRDLNLAKFDDNQFVEIAKGLKAYRGHYVRETATEQNPAKQLALKLYSNIPLVYSGQDLFDAIAYRWKSQICENAKTIAFHNYFPEFNHNEIVGFEKIEHIRNNLIGIILRDSQDHSRVAKRMQIISRQLQEKGIEMVNIYSQGDFLLGRIFSLIQLGDFASFYLAILNGIDPTPVAPIEDLKREMSEN